MLCDICSERLATGRSGSGQEADGAGGPDELEEEGRAGRGARATLRPGTGRPQDNEQALAQHIALSNIVRGHRSILN